uniref:E3 ubiquitin-protein ligase FANCL isoform X2 n=1 Tax=Elaeis guineensis var. tenera TaxID=51953 RepID=A0A6I9SGR9_ELAGV|nr:E3 ubiquitin-protein ligase FANCL isoform X2 [Elaeis guineensis]
MEQGSRQELPPPAPFYRSIFSEIEEVGWEHLVRSEEDLSSLSFRILDKNGRAHILEIALPRNYPESAPSIAADVPYICDIEWSKSSKLKNIVQQFREHLQKLQEFWSIMEDIDRNLWILDPKQPSLATSYRQICLGNDCSLLLNVYARNAWSLPECRFFGPDSTVNLLRNNWRKNSRKWTKDKHFHENLAILLETTLPRPHTVSNKNDEQVDCGICYAQYLPVDDEFGDNSGSAPDYTCENLSCSRAFHTVCLRDWLRSITTTRQSFDVLFGNCPYCSEPVAVKVSVLKGYLFMNRQNRISLVTLRTQKPFILFFFPITAFKSMNEFKQSRGGLQTSQQHTIRTTIRF